MHPPGSAATKPVVLIVDDEEEVADLYTAYLEDAYTVYTAYGGEEALERLDDSVDVVLLDRRMPGRSGAEIVDEINARSLRCRIALITAVEPDFDILDMGVDDYRVKPLDRETLRNTVEHLLSLREYEDVVQEYFELAAKIASLNATKASAELAASEEFQTTQRRFELIKTEARDRLEELMVDDEFEIAFNRLVEDDDIDPV